MDEKTLQKLLDRTSKQREEYYSLTMTLQGMLRDYYRLTADVPNPSNELKELRDETSYLLNGIVKRGDNDGK